MTFDFEKYLCFPETLAEGKTWFRGAVRSAGGTYDSFVMPGHNGPDGDDLSMDVGWFGASDASRVHISVCGTHGQEYFCGVAGQLNWIATGGPGNLPDDVAVCLVHASNPYGSAWNSRCNEDFVDLNRNYQSFDKPVRPNRLYAELFDLLFTKEMNEHVLDKVMAAFYDFWNSNDPDEAATAMGGGQNTHPSGTLYCGNEQSWSVKTLKEILTKYLQSAEKVAVIDWHTGLGDFGVSTPLIEELAPASDEFRWACTWWAGPAAGEELHKDGQPDFIGHVCDGIAADLRGMGKTVAQCVVEIGTVDNQAVLSSLLIDRWLRFECEDITTPHAVRMRAQMMERLNPSLPSWRKCVLAETSKYYERTIAGLTQWN